MEKNEYISLVKDHLISDYMLSSEYAEQQILEYHLSDRIDRCPFILSHDDPRHMAAVIMRGSPSMEESRRKLIEYIATDHSLSLDNILEKITLFDRLWRKGRESLSEDQIAKIKNVGLEMDMAEAFMRFSEGKIEKDDARKLARKGVPAFLKGCEDFTLLGHKGVDYYAREYIRAVDKENEE